jgi:hypothetical protein
VGLSLRISAVDSWKVWDFTSSLPDVFDEFVTHFVYCQVFTENNAADASCYSSSSSVEFKHQWNFAATPIADDMQAYECVSKIFRTGAAIYTAIMVARSTGRW